MSACEDLHLTRRYYWKTLLERWFVGIIDDRTHLCQRLCNIIPLVNKVIPQIDGAHQKQRRKSLAMYEMNAYSNTVLEHTGAREINLDPPVTVIKVRVRVEYIWSRSNLAKHDARKS